ncbi:MAG: ComEA family DNA-binding protein [Rhodoluna sp.]|nr:ComEA family DNA-binding protein [Rhodoluna sp.]
MLVWIKELLAEFSPRALKATITVLAVVAFGTYVFSSGIWKDNTATIPKGIETTDEPRAISSPKIYVHVAGSVKSPGIYQLESGTRVYDAVLAAGGFTAKANQASVNMARALNDGEQLLISSQNGVQSFENSMVSSLISLNQASASQLEELPGVGPALAGRMIDWRTANGGFKAKEDLLNVAGIGDKLFASVKDLVTL